MARPRLTKLERARRAAARSINERNRFNEMQDTSNLSPVYIKKLRRLDLQYKKSINALRRIERAECLEPEPESHLLGSALNSEKGSGRKKMDELGLLFKRFKKNHSKILQLEELKPARKTMEVTPREGRAPDTYEQIEKKIERNKDKCAEDECSISKLYEAADYERRVKFHLEVSNYLLKVAGTKEGGDHIKIRARIEILEQRLKEIKAARAVKSPETSVYRARIQLSGVKESSAGYDEIRVAYLSGLLLSISNALLGRRVSSVYRDAVETGTAELSRQFDEVDREILKLKSRPVASDPDHCNSPPGLKF